MNYQPNSKHLKWVLEQIEGFGGDEIEYNLNEFSKLDGAPPISIQRAILFQLAEIKAIKILEKYYDASGDLSKMKPAHGGGLAIEASGFKIKILHPQFDEFKIKLVSIKIVAKIYTSQFYDSKALLKIGETDVPLPAFTNEHYLCRAMFEYMVGEPVDWSVVFEKITGNEPGSKKKERDKNSRMVRDAMYALNERVREIVKTEKDFLDWKNKSIKRIF